MKPIVVVDVVNLLYVLEVGNLGGLCRVSMACGVWLRVVSSAGLESKLV